MLRVSELSFIGHITEQALVEVRADKVFMGTRGVSLEHGLTNDYLQETLTDRAIMNSGHEVIIVADHTKVNRVSTVLLAPWNSVRTFATDSRVDKKFVQAMILVTCWSRYAFGYSTDGVGWKHYASRKLSPSIKACDQDHSGG
jgi:DeoR family transcriptional regulator, aga operon transcriptional repressor